MTGDQSTEEDPVTLFSPGQIATGAFIGGPLPGTILLARNYMALGNKAYAIRTVLLGLAATFVLFGVAAILPEGFPNMVVPVVYTIGFREVARHLQGEAIAVAEAAGRKGSWLVPFALGLGFMAAMLLLLIFTT